MMAIAVGQVMPAIVATTVLLVVPMIETVLLPEFMTYARVPSGVMATPIGAKPTGTVAVTALVPTSMTETVLST